MLLADFIMLINEHAKEDPGIMESRIVLSSDDEGNGYRKLGSFELAVNDGVNYDFEEWQGVKPLEKVLVLY